MSRPPCALRFSPSAPTVNSVPVFGLVVPPTLPTVTSASVAESMP
jgi:hypothetical protein